MRSRSYIHPIFAISESNSDDTSRAMRSKLLSLEMLRLIFQHPTNEVFRTSEWFISSIRHYLMVSLTRNTVSTHLSVTEVSLDILLRVIHIFRQSLKVSISDPGLPCACSIFLL